MDNVKTKKSGGFESMGLGPGVYKAIKHKGYNVPTPIQRKAIPLIMAGNDIVGCSKTGSGKTAAFIIPLVSKLQCHSTIVGVRGLLMLPTRELALQTAQVLKQFVKFTDLTYSLMVGGHGFEGQFESLASNPDILICTPGRLLQHLEEERLKLSRVQMVIYDEADFLFEMGLGDQLRSIMKYLPPQKQCLIFSATIPEQLSLFASAGLKDYSYVKLDKEYQFPDTMALNFILCSSQHKLSALLYLINRIQDTCLVFASTKYLVDLLSFVLTKFNISCVHVYGKMDQLARKEQLENFRRQQAKVLIVTDLASRGIDIPFVANVIHYDYPSQPKIFIHRSGRTARAGKKGSVYSLIAPEEILYIKETMLYAGRKLVHEGDLEDTSLAFYGQIPLDLIMDYQQQLNEFNDDLEYQNLALLAKNANEQFRKTRGSAKKVKSDIDATQVNPLFKNVVGQDNAQQKMLEEIKNFKSTQSVIEIKKLDQNQKQDPFMKAVSHLKKIKKRQPIHSVIPQQVQLKKQVDFSAFIDQSHYIPNVKDINKKSEFDELQKIQMEDINQFIIGEDYEGLRKSKQPKRVWDRKTRNYKYVQDKEDKGMDVEKGKKLFNKWQKRNQLEIQQVGEEEDTYAIKRAQEMFKKRQMRSKGFYFDDNNNNNNNKDQKQYNRNEIKNKEQLLKSRKIKKDQNLKNMQKGKRRVIEKQIRTRK